MSTTFILKTFLTINLLLIQLDAAIDYRALPRSIVIHARPNTDQARVLAIGKFTIAALVGAYTLAALLSHSAGSTWCSIFLALYFSSDAHWAAKKYLRHPTAKPNTV